jgi:hypothetical protein
MGISSLGGTRGHEANIRKEGLAMSAIIHASKRGHLKMRWGGPITRPIQVGRHGSIRFSRGLAVFHTVPGALRIIRELHRRALGSKRTVSLRSVRLLEPWQAKILYERAVPCALATLQVSSRLARIDLCSGIFDFVRSSQSVDGLESLVLSAIVATRHEEPRVAEAGVALWRRLAASASKEVTPVIDVGRNQISFLTPGQLGASTKEASVTNQIFGNLPGWGEDASAGSNQSCISNYTTAGTILGGVGGVAGGILAGVAVGAGAGPIGIIGGAIIGGIGGFIVGLLGGAQGGQSFGTSVICTNTAPGFQDGIGWVLGGDAPPAPNDQGYSAGFDAGFNAATGGGPSPAGAGSLSGQGFADGYAVGSGIASTINTPTTVMNADGSTTTTTPDGTQTTTSADGSTIISTIDGTTSTVSPDGTVTTTTADGATTSVNSPDGTITTTTSDGSTTTTTPDGTTTTTDDGEPNPDPDKSFPDPDGDTGGGGGGPRGGGPVSLGAFTASANAFPAGLGLNGLVTSVTVGDSHTYFIAGMPQLASGGGLANAGILAGLSE